MSNRTLQIALRIALINEEFPESEILEAVKLLEDLGSTSLLLSHLAGRKREVKAIKRVRHRNKPLDEQRSKVVSGLKYREPEKYEVLAEFDSLLRKANVLPEVNDVKRLGEKLSKGFASPPPKSRRESISRLLTLLADRPLEEIREIIRTSLITARVAKDDNDYQQLAQFIITGKTSQAERTQT